jgi:hypothetical protein
VGGIKNPAGRGGVSANFCKIGSVPSPFLSFLPYRQPGSVTAAVASLLVLVPGFSQYHRHVAGSLALSAPLLSPAVKRGGEKGAGITGKRTGVYAKLHGGDGAGRDRQRQWPRVVRGEAASAGAGAALAEQRRCRWARRHVKSQACH